jgi:hypothetical protein
MLSINQNLLYMFPVKPMSTATPHEQCMLPPVQCSMFEDPNPIYVNLDMIAPLEYSEFLSCVLIPFTAILLIQEDRKTTFMGTWNCWYASGPWGLMHSSYKDYPNAPLLNSSHSNVILPSSEPPKEPASRARTVSSESGMADHESPSVAIKVEPDNNAQTHWQTVTINDTAGKEVEVYILDD